MRRRLGRAAGCAPWLRLAPWLVSLRAARPLKLAAWDANRQPLTRSQSASPRTMRIAVTGWAYTALPRSTRPSAGAAVWMGSKRGAFVQGCLAARFHSPSMPVTTAALSNPATAGGTSGLDEGLAGERAGKREASGVRRVAPPIHHSAHISNHSGGTRAQVHAQACRRGVATVPLSMAVVQPSQRR